MTNDLASGVFSNLKTLKFPYKLYHILQSSERYKNIIEWMHEGESFRILDEELFVKNIIPIYFPGTQFETFIRQLNLYGFETQEKGKKTNIGKVYASNLFIRGREDLLHDIKRAGTKQSTKDKSGESVSSKRHKRAKLSSSSSVDLQVPSDDSSMGSTTQSETSPRDMLPCRSPHSSYNCIVQSDREASVPSTPRLPVASHSAATSTIDPQASILSSHFHHSLPTHLSSGSTGVWLALRTVSTKVTEHVQCTFIPRDLITLHSEPLHINSLLADVTDSDFTIEHFLSSVTAPSPPTTNHHPHSQNTTTYEYSTVLESRISPVEYIVAHTPYAGFDHHALLSDPLDATVHEHDWSRLAESLSASGQVSADPRQVRAVKVESPTQVALASAETAAIPPSSSYMGERQTGTTASGVTPGTRKRRPA